MSALPPCRILGKGLLSLRLGFLTFKMELIMETFKGD